MRRGTSLVGCAAVEFAITLHSGFAAPDDALERLWQRLGSSREEARFAKSGSQIWVTYGHDLPLMDRSERSAVDRLAVLEIVRGVCESAPDLECDWFAVRPLG